MGLRTGVYAYKFENPPHLIATRMAFWLGVFSKIQSMFTNIPLAYAKTVPKDPKRKGLKVTIAPLTNKLA